MNFHPLVWGYVADGLVEKTLTPGTLGMWLAIMFGTYLVGAGTNAVHSYLMEKTGQAVVRDLRCELFAKFEAQSLAYHRDTSTGELVTRITSDVDAMEQSVLQGLTSLLEEIVTFIAVAGMVLWISPVVGAASILPLAFAFIFIRKYNLRVKSIYEGVRKKLGHIGSFVQDRLAGIQVTQSFAREAAEKETFDERADLFYEASVKASKLRNTYFPIVSIFGFINNLIMLGLGAWLIMKGSDLFTLGALLAYRGFWWRLQSPIRTIAQTSDILQRARAAAQRVLEIIDTPVKVEEKSEALPWREPVGRIEFREVRFHYVSAKPILRSVSFTV
ncbi:MAG: ABC transporter transmembrane domain-containing protein, partial [Verrucomicrobiales bacterium]|nr:ABC transporter transmembrane domain-containing protein [Verrucomicrobiales bacterium]